MPVFPQKAEHRGAWCPHACDTRNAFQRERDDVLCPTLRRRLQALDEILSGAHVICLLIDEESEILERPAV